MYYNRQHQTVNEYRQGNFPMYRQKRILKHLFKTVPEFKPVWKRELKINLNADVFKALAFFVMHVMDKAENPELPGPEFHDADDLLARTFEALEYFVINRPELIDSINKRFISALVLIAPASYYRIKAFAKPSVAQMFTMREEQHPDWIELMNPDLPRSGEGE